MKARTLVIAAALSVGMSAAASAQYLYQPPSYAYPQPRTAPPTYLPQQNDPPMFNPPPTYQLPGIGNLPGLGCYRRHLGGQITTDCQ
jgi:hypothetical protein